MNDTNQPSSGVVLIADDDELFRESQAMLLQRHGYICACAPDGATSKKLLREMEIDLLIADINMPGNSALELVESIPQIAPGLPVILLTGDPTIETAAHSVRLAVTAYLTKPPDVEELLSLVKQSVTNHRRLRAVRESRRHLQSWAEELAPIEESLGGSPGAMPGAAAQDYLRVTLRNLTVQLGELDRLIGAWSRSEPAADELRQLDLINAVRHTIEVLEKSRQNFKSKELGELRKQLQSLVPKDQAKSDTASGPGSP